MARAGGNDKLLRYEDERSGVKFLENSQVLCLVKDGKEKYFLIK